MHDMLADGYVCAQMSVSRICGEGGKLRGASSHEDLDEWFNGLLGHEAGYRVAVLDSLSVCRRVC